MKTFFTPKRQWAPSGDAARRLHVYIHPGPGVAPMMSDVKEALQPWIDNKTVQLVESPWWHFTVAAWPAAGETFSTEEVDALAQRLTTAPAIEVTVGGWTVTRSSVLTRATVGQEWQDLLKECDDGHARLEQHPHLTAAYGVGNADSGDIGSAVWQVGQHVTVTVRDVLIVDAIQSPHDGTYTWDTLRTVPLTSPTA